MSVPWVFTGVFLQLWRSTTSFFGFACINLEAVLLEPIHKALDVFSVLPVVPMCDGANDCGVVREVLKAAVGGAVSEVCSAEGEEERTQDCSLWGPCATDNNVGLTVRYPHVLWSVGEVAHDPSCEVGVHYCALQLVPQKRGLRGTECTGKIQKHDSHSAPSLFQVRKGSRQ